MKFLKKYWQGMVLFIAFLVFISCMKISQMGVLEYVALFMFVINIAAEAFFAQE